MTMGLTLRARAGAILLALGVLVHAAWLFHFWQESPFARHLLSDAYRYDAWARELAAHDFAYPEPFHQAPGYPYAIAALFRLSGGRLFPALVVQAVLCGLVPFLVFRIGRRWFGPGAGIAAGALALPYSPLLAFAPRLLPAVPSVVLELLLLDRLSSWEGPGRARWRDSLVAGVLLGGLCVARSNLLLLVAWIAVAGILLGRAPRRHAAACAAIAIAVVAPVTAHNLRHGAAFVPVATNGGETFYHGNNPDAVGTYSLMAGLASGDIHQQAGISRRIAERESGRALTPAGVSAFWFRKGLTFIRERPGRYLWLELQKLRLMLGAEEVPDIYSPRLEAARVTPALRWAFLDFRWTLPLAVAGLVRIGRRLSPWFLGLLLVHAATLLGFYVSNRYRLPLEALLLVPAGVALARLRARRTWIALAPAVALSVLLQATADARRTPAAWGIVMANLGVSQARAGEYVDAERSFRESISLSPDWARAHHYLGRTLAHQRRYEEAVGAFRRATELAPSDGEMRLDLVRALAASDRPTAAAAELAFAEGTITGAGDPDVSVDASDLWLRFGRPAEAARLLQAAASSAPGSAAIWHRLGIARRAAGELPAAREALERSLELEPARPAVWIDLVRAHLDLEDCDAARASMADARHRAGSAPEVFREIEGEVAARCAGGS
jgi:tetratricopeptide (TPR) repeat protein